MDESRNEITANLERAEQSIHQRFVKTGRLAKEQGKDLNRLFELRGVGDYGGPAHVSPGEAEQAIQAAVEFLSAVQSLLT